MKANIAERNETKSSRPSAKGASCSCQCQGECHCGARECCANICFERPNYFCGQLLTDADLSAAQAYVREKQKLYHRTLHGEGIVCGLRLTCDPACEGHIRIGEGYAIDDCGNDLVVCETISFDLITALRAKDWLIETPRRDPCGPEKPPPCKVKQCFQVTLCYAEEEIDFTMPFKGDCGPEPAACEPTRIRETVRIDVLRHAPKPRNRLDEIEERITRCWGIFTDGPLAARLKEFFASLTRHDDRQVDYQKAFCQLKVLFQFHLKRCPDSYDCSLACEVEELECPEGEGRDYQRYRECFCKLFELIRRYAYHCMLGEVIFSCACPPKASCVVLGTVEVEDGRLLGVCNCPRSYVWSFANFYEVLLATLVSGEACAPARQDRTDVSDSERRPREEECGCCASFDFHCERFMALLAERPDFGKLAAAAPIRAIREMTAALRQGFDFTDPLAFSPAVFEHMTPERAEEFARALERDTPFSVSAQPPGEMMSNPADVLLSHMLRQPSDPLIAFSRDDRIVNVLPGQTAERAATDLQALRHRLDETDRRAADIEKLLGDQSRLIEELRSQIAAQTPSEPPPKDVRSAKSKGADRP